MSTVSALTPVDPDLKAHANERITRNILILMAAKGMRRPADLAEVVTSIKRSTLYSRFNGEQPTWAAWELLELARVLDVEDIAVFYRDPAEVLAQNRKKMITSDLPVRLVRSNEAPRSNGQRALLSVVHDDDL